MCSLYLWRSSLSYALEIKKVQWSNRNAKWSCFVMQSLCNACGIKSRKKRQAALVTRPEEKKKNRKSSSGSDLTIDHPRIAKKKMDKDDDPKTCNSSKSSSSSSSRKGVSKFLDLGFKVPVMKRSSVEKKRLWRKLGEEERAAVLLMALSCGSVHA